MSTKSAIIDIHYDENGEAFIELPEWAGLKEGDVIEWEPIDDGSKAWRIVKKEPEVETEIVMVTTISQFRWTHAVRVPKGKADWALDTVAMNESDGIFQKHLGETIISHQVVAEEDYLKEFDRLDAIDGGYFTKWTPEQKLKQITDISKEK